MTSWPTLMYSSSPSTTSPKRGIQTSQWRSKIMQCFGLIQHCVILSSEIIEPINSCYAVINPGPAILRGQYDYLRFPF